MLMQYMLNDDDPRNRRVNDPLHGASGLQNGGAGNVEVQKQISSTRAPRSYIGTPKNYIPLPEGRQYVRDSFAYMHGAGTPLFLEWCGSVEHTRLQPSTFSNEHDAQAWRQGEWLRQKGRRRFSNKKILEEYIGKRYSTNESAQAAFQQKQFRHPSSENRFYAFLKGMSASFGTLE